MDDIVPFAFMVKKEPIIAKMNKSVNNCIILYSGKNFIYLI